MKTLSQFLEEANQPIQEGKSLRIAAMNGMGTETKQAAVRGREIDYFHPETGNKHSGTIVSVGYRDYVVKDHETGKSHNFKYYNKKKHMAMNEDTQCIVVEDVELKRHENGKHYIVHKIRAKSGITSDQLKVGETLNDTHVDDLKDMGYKVKIHK